MPPTNQLRATGSLESACCLFFQVKTRLMATLVKMPVTGRLDHRVGLEALRQSW